MKPRLEKIYCELCGKDEVYKYIGGPKRKNCTKCQPGVKKKSVKPSQLRLNAYDFDWGVLGRGWHPTRQGNIQKWFGMRLGVIYRQAGFFVFWRPRQTPLKSTIEATTENVPIALAWAEKGMENFHNLRL